MMDGPICVDLHKHRFMPEKEYVESFTNRGEVVPPFLVFVPHVIIDGVPGYLVPTKLLDEETHTNA